MSQTAPFKVPFESYVDVQNALNEFVRWAKVTPGDAPHGVFWNALTYEEFISADVPGVPGSYKILVRGDSKRSTIIQILSGIGDAAANFGQMPQPSPPYNPQQQELIDALAAWIDAGCPNGSGE